MTNWDYKNMDAVAAISRRYAEDASLPHGSRERFLSSFYLASTLKHFNGVQCGNHLKRAFDTMCDACKDAQLRRCADAPATFHRCPLVVEYSS